MSVGLPFRGVLCRRGLGWTGMWVRVLWVRVLWARGLRYRALYVEDLFLKLLLLLQNFLQHEG